MARDRSAVTGMTNLSPTQIGLLGGASAGVFFGVFMGLFVYLDADRSGSSAVVGGVTGASSSA